MTLLRWKLVIMFAFLIFIYSVLSQQVLLTALALILGLLASRQNLFKEYDEKQEEKRKCYSEMMEKYRQEKSGNA